MWKWGKDIKNKQKYTGSANMFIVATTCWLILGKKEGGTTAPPPSSRQ